MLISKGVLLNDLKITLMSSKLTKSSIKLDKDWSKGKVSSVISADLHVYIVEEQVMLNKHGFELMFCFQPCAAKSDWAADGFGDLEEIWLHQISWRYACASTLQASRFISKYVYSHERHKFNVRLNFYQKFYCAQSVERLFGTASAWRVR